MTNEKVFIYKLSSGEEIVGKVVKVNDDILTLRSPFRVERIVNEGAVFYVLRAWICQQFESFEERTVDISVRHVIATFKPGDNMLQQYQANLDYFLSPTGEIEGETDSDEDEGDIWAEFPETGRLN